MLARAISTVVLVIIQLAATPAQARDWFVAPGGTGDGTSGAPFGSVQHGLDAAAAQAVCDRILARLADPEPGAEDGDGQVHASIGIATAAGGESAPDVDTLLRTADEALYAVKRSGKGRAIVHET